MNKDEFEEWSDNDLIIIVSEYDVNVNAIDEDINQDYNYLSKFCFLRFAALQASFQYVKQNFLVGFDVLLIRH